MGTSADLSRHGHGYLALMHRRTSVRATVGCLVFVGAIAYGLPAVADISPLWTDGELVGFSRVVVMAEVTRVTSRWDDAVEGIYTYVTVRIEEVLKGNVSRRRITLKQLGGQARGRGLQVAGQPTFSVGEHVVLFLEVRPRDNTLYTTAHWQGKWRIERDAATGEEYAVRAVPGDTAQLRIVDAETRPLRGLLRTIRARAAETEGQEPAPQIRFTPPELVEPNSDPDDIDPFALFGPARWHEADNGGSIAVDMQAGGQPGLAGGGFNEVGLARGAVNGAGSALNLSGGNTTGFGCFGDSRGGDGRIRVSFMDPCGEMDNSGGTLAAATFWSWNGLDKVVNGTNFLAMATGTVINNDSASALPFLANSSCFYVIQLHEILHAVGLGHSADPSAVMFPTVNFGNCSNQLIQLGGDDVAGLAFIYPGGGGGGGGTTAPGAPSNLTASASGSTVTISWGAPASGGTPTAYILEAGSSSGGTDILVSNVGLGNSLIAENVQPLTAYLGMRATNSAGTSGRSNEVLLVVGGGGGGPCTGPPGVVTGLSFNVSGSTVTLTWNRPGGGNAPTTYFLRAGSGPGQSNLVPNLDLGGTNTTLVASSVGSGIYYVRIYPGNNCGVQVIPSNEGIVIVP